MKTQIINFFYQGAKDNSYRARQIYVLNQTPEYVQGIDFGVLSPKERATVKKYFKNRTIKNEFVTRGMGGEHTNSTLDIIIKKAFRNFKTENLYTGKVKINNPEKFCEKLGSKAAIKIGIKRAVKNYKGFQIVKKDDYYQVNLLNHSAKVIGL